MKVWELTVNAVNGESDEHYFSERPRQMTAGESGCVRYEGEMVELAYTYRLTKPDGSHVVHLGPGTAWIAVGNVYSWSVRAREWIVTEEDE